MLPGNTEDIFALMELCDLEEQITKSANGTRLST